MNRVFPTPGFVRKAKRLAKRYATLLDSISRLEQQLLAEPKLGIPYGNNIYKIRLADKSKGKGKSGGLG